MYELDYSRQLMLVSSFEKVIFWHSYKAIKELKNKIFIKK